MGERVYMPVELVDLAPTILGIVGTKQPDTFMGHDMLSAEYDKTQIIAGGRNGRAAIIRDGVKYYRYKIQDLEMEKALDYNLSGLPFKEELYDLKKDPYEQFNKAGGMPGDLEELADIADSLDSISGHGAGRTELDDDVTDRLRQIGYIT